MPLVGRPPGQQILSPLLLRKNIAVLPDAQLTAFRNAVSQAMALTDDRGYSYFAGWHGVPFNWCEHGTEWFLPWHRAYLHLFELALQRLVAGVTLPWWDWTTTNTVPSAYVDAPPDGSTNPLTGGDIMIFGSGRSQGQTQRSPGTDPQVPPLPYADRYAAAQATTSFADFTQALEQIHNDVHVWVGGTMSDISYAAYDPLFFAHHTMIDRSWRIWQQTNPGALPPAAILDQAFPRGGPPGLTPRQVLDVTTLGYDYAVSEATAAGPS